MQYSTWNTVSIVDVTLLLVLTPWLSWLVQDLLWRISLEQKRKRIKSKMPKKTLTVVTTRSRKTLEEVFRIRGRNFKWSNIRTCWQFSDIWTLLDKSWQTSDVLVYVWLKSTRLHWNILVFPWIFNAFFIKHYWVFF